MNIGIVLIGMVTLFSVHAVAFQINPNVAENYAGQDTAKHDGQYALNALKRNILQSQPSVVEVSKTVIDLWRKKTNWTAAEPYFSCVFALDDKAQPAAPGDAFRRN